MTDRRWAQKKHPTMTKKAAAGATPRHFGAALKREAVRLWQSSWQSAETTARELGISVLSLLDWKRRHGRTAGGERATAPGAGTFERAKGHPKKSRGHPLPTVAERYARIQAMSDEHPIQRIYAVFAVSRNGYYAWLRGNGAARLQQEAQLPLKIAAVHRQSRQTYSSPSITIELRTQGERIGRLRVARLMRQAVCAAGRNGPFGCAQRTAGTRIRLRPTGWSRCRSPPSRIASG